MILYYILAFIIGFAAVLNFVGNDDSEDLISLRDFLNFSRKWSSIKPFSLLNALACFREIRIQLECGMGLLGNYLNASYVSSYAISDVVDMHVEMSENMSLCI